MSSYVSSADEFDEKFVNEYYSRLEVVIKSIHRKSATNVGPPAEILHN